MICKLILASALKFGLPPLMLASVIHQESAFNPSAVNSVAPIASYGIGQLTKATAIHHCKLKENDLLDLRKNLECSAKVLAYQYRRYNGDTTKVLSAYNAGTYTTRNQEYVILVKKRMKQNYCEIPNETT